MTGSPSPLQGGARRRRLGPRLALLAALLLTAAAGAGIWRLAAADDGGDGRLSVAGGPPAAAGQDETEAPEAPSGPRGIALEGVDAFRLEFRRPPRAGIVFDVDTGEVLWRHNPLGVRPVASLTKVATAIAATRRTEAREEARIAKSALRYSGSGVGLLPKGRHVSVEALLHGLMLVSGNDAAQALAIHVAGSHRRFVRMMNRDARRLGLACTRFVSAHGLERGNRSCAADLAALTRVAMREFRIARVVRKREAALRFPIKGGRLYLNSTNPLLRARYPGAIGLKTGYTTEAGRCLIGVARRGRRTLGVVLLRSPDPGGQARRLLNRAFHTPPSAADGA
jgi:serine-type D-Ala-D-Ala carboxypeptidase (penicillin-binding protein 5/6)